MADDHTTGLHPSIDPVPPGGLEHLGRLHELGLRVLVIDRLERAVGNEGIDAPRRAVLLNARSLYLRRAREEIDRLVEYGFAQPLQGDGPWNANGALPKEKRR